MRTTPNSFRVRHLTLVRDNPIAKVRKLLRAMDALAVDDFCWVETKHRDGASSFIIEGRKKYLDMLAPAIFAALQ